MALVQEMDGGTPWIPISQLIADDGVFRKPETAQIAYAESWVLVHYLMETEERLPKFRAYLAGLAPAGRFPGDEPREVRGIAAGIAARAGHGGPPACPANGEEGGPAGAGRAQPRTGLSPMFFRISARCFS